MSAAHNRRNNHNKRAESTAAHCVEPSQQPYNSHHNAHNGSVAISAFSPLSEDKLSAACELSPATLQQNSASP